MIEVSGNIWDFDGFHCVTTNSVVKQNGELVMGRGVALDAATRYPSIPKKLGDLVKQYGNKPFIFFDEKIISFPTKHHWKNPSDIELIIKSSKSIALLAEIYNLTVFLTRPGCGNGGLQWDSVKLQIEPYLNNRFTVVF